MNVFADLLRHRTGLDEAALEHLQLLLVDWKILADLSFADLLLFVRDHDSEPGYRCIGQARPYTAQTIYPDDLVGEFFPLSARPMVGRAFDEQRVIRDADPDWSTGVPVREEAIPVRFRRPGSRQGTIVAVVTREANVAAARSPSQLELTYLRLAGELAQMLADGLFPYPGDTLDREFSPRVGDGLIRLEADGGVSFASPNAISAYRRLGTRQNLLESKLEEFDPLPNPLVDGLHEGRPAISEVERERAIVLRRLLPLLVDGRVTGGLLLVREITELRRHERALQVKDATIREIHHRVKNNLQTVASLLRLQTRRLRSDEARQALEESVRRIASIALVHEMLSQESRQRVNFDKIARRIIAMLADGLVDPRRPVAFDLDGQAGDLPAEVASPLALILTELVQNSVEHAFPAPWSPPGTSGAEPTGGAMPAGGTVHEGAGRRRGLDRQVRIGFEADLERLRLVVRDNGVGLPGEQDLDGLSKLGLQIARTLAEAELGGTFRALPGEGTAIEVVVPLA